MLKLKPTPVLPTEHEEQVRVIKWCDAQRDPRASLIYSHLNGLRAPLGAVVKAKAAGGRKGIPDLFLPVPSQGYHGLYVEMKRLKLGKISPEQKEWIARLGAMGYRVEVCKGHEVAIAIIQDYLGLT
jgi:hypothetical protein